MRPTKLIKMYYIGQFDFKGIFIDHIEVLFRFLDFFDTTIFSESSFVLPISHDGTWTPKNGCLLFNFGCGILSISSGVGLGASPVSTCFERTIFPLNCTDTEMKKIENGWSKNVAN